MQPDPNVNEFTELPPLQEAMRQRCMHPSGRFVEFPMGDVEHSLSQRFEQQVELYPEQVAVKTPWLQLTYSELNEMANRIAHALPRVQGAKQRAIGLLVDSDPLAIATMLGVLKSGNFFITLDPAFPLERIAYMLEDAGAELILTNHEHSELARTLAGTGRQVLLLGEIDARSPAENPGRATEPDDIAYLMYTSGTTGQPKGIVHSQRSVLFGVRNYTNALYVCPQDRLTLLHSLSFSSGIVDTFRALLNGASLFPWDVKRNGMADLGAWLAREEITVLDWMPTAYRYFVQTLPEQPNFPKLRLLLLGGEAVFPSDVQLYKSHFSCDCIFMNRLGTTETWNFRLYFVDHDSEIGDLMPAGYGVPGKRLLLLDDEGRDVGTNEVGEIFVQSRYLALGYWKKPELTEKAFLPDPAGGDERIYRTGDLGILRDDGCLEFRGRKDFQVKVRGYRIETSEVEAALNDLESIREAAVIVKESETAENQLIAYFVPSARQAPTNAELRAALARRLPDHMVPSIYIQMEALPVTATGKVDRKALPVPVARKLEPEQAALPIDEIEYRLATVWEKILGTESVGINDNFFELGGHSLSAMRLLLEVERLYGQRLPQTILLQFPTVRTLAEVIREKRTVDEASFASVLPLNPNGARTPIFCMPGIMGNVFSDLGSLAQHLGPDQPVYGLQDGLRLPARVQDKAKSFLDEIVRIQPQGPYVLSGICSGALTVTEIARQLRANGKEVAVLALIEPVLPWKPGLRSAWDFANSVYHRLTRRRQTHARNVAQMNLLNQARYVRLKLKLIANMWASRWYAAKPYTGTIHLFSTRPSLDKTPRSFQVAWDGLATQGIQPHEVPGTHNAITGDYETPIEDATMRVIARGLIEVIDGAPGTIRGADGRVTMQSRNVMQSAIHSD